MSTILVLATIFATTLMTLFSYFVAWIFKQPYKEPFLLAVLLNHFHVTNNTINRALGWILHYVLGLFFVVGFHLLLYAKWLPLGWYGASIYGIVIGLMGIVSWHIMFNLSSKKPKMNYTGYYLQLFLAHMLFSYTTLACYELF